ncbi:MAG: transcription elongation factor [Deltaproteobacteria bacterium]|nr:transcription elongation factor [Deltaproteobacteria bacterium]
MPEKQTIERAKTARRKGKSATTQAGEFVREEIHHIRRGKHGARSAKQAIAIGLSKARRAGVSLPPPKKGTVSEKTRRSAERAYESGQSGNSKPSPRRSRATEGALKREGRTAASRKALSRQTRSAARKRTRAQRSASARRAAGTKGRRGRSAAARKAARTRGRQG